MSNAYLLERMQYFSKCIEYFEFAHKINQKNEIVCYQLALMYGKILEIDTALSYIKKALQINKYLFCKFLKSNNR